MKYIVQGNKRLKGQVKVGGAKNAMLPLLAALLITNGDLIIQNVPLISDVSHKINLLRNIGAKITYLESNVISVNFSSVDINKVDCGYGIRTTILLLGGLLSRFDSCKVPVPRGDKIGRRPYDMHIDVLSKMGVEISENEQYILCKKTMPLKAIDYTFRLQSVGATQNAIILAVIANGTSVLKNCAQEIEIQFLCNTLNMLGANINGIGTSQLTIKGRGKCLEQLQTQTISVIPDRLQAVTYLLSPLFTEGEVKVIHNNIHQVLHGAPLHLLAQMGAEVILDKDSITCNYQKQSPINYCMLQTGPYPGFNTDSHPMFFAAMNLHVNNAMVYENVYENRFQYAKELKKLGAKIAYNNKVIKSRNINQFQPGNLFANDIRCGATCTLAALNSQGTSSIDNVHQIHRGYENFLENFNNLGADIILLAQ